MATKTRGSLTHKAYFVHRFYQHCEQAGKHHIFSIMLLRVIFTDIVPRARIAAILKRHRESMSMMYDASLLDWFWARLARMAIGTGGPLVERKEVATARRTHVPVPWSWQMDGTTTST
jgi:hypothetical protein